LTNFAGGIYPPFVTALRHGAVPDNIPVFSFHDVCVSGFESQLSYLASNGYETVSAGEYLKLGGKSGGKRRVMLTFDDGRASLWTVAAPLLKKYGMKGVAFVLPGEIKEAESPRPQQEGIGGELLCTWPEISAMRDVLDIQSHSLTHMIMFASTRLEMFYTPQLAKKWSLIDKPVMRQNEEDRLERDYPLGSPFYETDSRFSPNPRVFDPEDVRAACCRFVEENGGENFFRRDGWEAELQQIHAGAVSKAKFILETEDERAAAMERAMGESKRIIEQKLQGHTVSHFCFPFGVGCDLAVDIAAKTGYGAVYWGTTPQGKSSGEWGNPSGVTRLKDDFVFRLPGEGRLSLLSIFAGKFLRRIGAGK